MVIETFFESYFQNIANKLKFIGPVAEGSGKQNVFFIDSLDNLSELNDAMRRKAPATLLIVELFEDQLTDQNADSNRALITSAFAVLQQVPAKADISARRIAKAQCRDQARKIAHRLKFDALNGELYEQNILCKLQNKGFEVGPVADSYFGWRYTFEWNSFENIKINPADWY